MALPTEISVNELKTWLDDVRNHDEWRPTFHWASWTIDTMSSTRSRGSRSSSRANPFGACTAPSTFEASATTLQRY